LRNDHRITYISLFKNEGELAGATQLHSHTQLIGLPLVPKDIRDEYQRSYEHYKHNKSSLFEEIITHEEEEGVRVIDTNALFTAYCPYASAYPFEIIISSKKALGQIDTLSEKSIETLAPLLLSTLRKLKVQLGYLDFNLVLSTPPLQEGSVEHELLCFIDQSHRFSIRIMPRIYKFGGFEKSTGVIINPVSPELAAKLLRETKDA
jgi:UDPglucose--hexose-1-phosphate uridylyltransferase